MNPNTACLLSADCSESDIALMAGEADLPSGIPVGATAEELADALSREMSAERCVALANLAEKAGHAELRARGLGQAVSLDRHCQAALLGLAADANAAGDVKSTYAFLEEADRAGVLPEEVRPLLESLRSQVVDDAGLQHYLAAIGHRGIGQAAPPLSVVLVTNLFPPQELGGYGRMMWEFAHGLIARGHRVRVLTSDVTEFSHVGLTGEEREMERHVSRTLQLLGSWVGGRGVPLSDPNQLARRVRDNAARLRTAIDKCNADLVLAGNLDFFGPTLLGPALQRDVPTLHALANGAPGYAVAHQPASPHYWVAPCSDWNSRVFHEAGYHPARIETLYPGARIDRFFRLFLPDIRRLRICYASLVLPYKGADTLVQALCRLHAAGIDFTAEIAGDAPDKNFLGQLQAQVQASGMEHKVQFTGFLNRPGLAALFARSNVLVFPSRFQEPFGISQVEAMAAGLVVVSSGTGGAAEIVRDGRDGLLFAAGNDADLASKLLALARTPEAMARLQRGGQARAVVFSVEKAVAKIEALAGEMRGQA